MAEWLCPKHHARQCQYCVTSEQQGMQAKAAIKKLHHQPAKLHNAETEIKLMERLLIEKSNDREYPDNVTSINLQIKVEDIEKSSGELNDNTFIVTKQSNDLDRDALLVEISEMPQKRAFSVRVYKADITQVKTCAIVSSTNLHLKHFGSVAAAIAREAGPDLERDCKEYVKKHGDLKVTDVVPTTAGNLPCTMVLHAVGPRWGDYEDKNKNLCQILLAKTVLNCLETANNQNCTALAISAIGAGKNRIPKDVCAHMYLAAIQRFAQKDGNNNILKKIHFVDIDDDTVTTIRDIFSRYWDSEIKFRNGEKIVWD